VPSGLQRVEISTPVPNQSQTGLIGPTLLKGLQQQIEINFKDEQDAVRQYNEAVKICVEARDEGSKALFDRMIQERRASRGFLGRSAPFHQGEWALPTTYRSSCSAVSEPQVRKTDRNPGTFYCVC